MVKLDNAFADPFSGPCIYPQRTTTSIVGSIILITAGTITAANGDLDFDVKSYTFGICSVLSQVRIILCHTY